MGLWPRANRSDPEHTDAAQYGFDWTDCEQDFASNQWVGESGESITWPTTHVINPPGVTLECR